MYCNGDAAPLTPVSGPITGTTFTWSNDNINIGLPANGSGNIPAFTATNGTNAAILATITITPASGTCPGIPSSYTITVNPTPSVNPVGNQTYCNGDAVTETALSGPVAGTQFSWVNDNTAIGLGASGTGNIPAFTASNGTTDPIFATITITPTANNCTGPNTSFTITINPTPLLSSTLTPPAVCSESEFSYEPTSLTTGVVFTWSRAVVTGISNPAANGSGIITESLINTTNNPIPVTYEYTLTANGCTNTQEVVVVVGPIPTMTSDPPSPTICSNTLFSYSPSGPVAGTSFDWTRAAVAGISNPAASGSGDINETLINTSAIPVAVTYAFILSTPECINPDTVNIVVVVIPSPEVTATASDAQICPGDPFDLYSSSNIGTSLPQELFSEGFNGLTNNWTTINNSTGGNPGDAAWKLRPDGYYFPPTFHSNDNSQFYLSNSRDQGYGSTTETYLISPAINTVGYTTLQLDFYQYYRDNYSSYARVEVSTNGFSWSTLVTYTSRGSSADFRHETINLNGFINNPALYIRFHYHATYDYYWAIDNVSITGTSPSPACTWTSIPPGFTSTENNPTGVTQTVTTSYIATYVDTETNCPGSDTVTVEVMPVADAHIDADYCSIQGKILLTAYPSGCTYLWNTGESGQAIEVDEVGIYSVTVTNAFGCSATAYVTVANELVTDGDFTNFDPLNTSFFTEYGQHQAYWNEPPPPTFYNTGLGPEGLYAVNLSAWTDYPYPPDGYHTNFHGRDHTNNTVGPRNFMMINGDTQPIWDPITGTTRQRIIWQQTIPVTPNTDYYFSAWGMNLNPVSPAILQFEINGVLVGSVANLDFAQKPTSESQISLQNWVRFYSTPFWNSGAATTAVIRIRDLNTIAGGNDFGLDDISFGTLSPVPMITNPQANGGFDLCEGDTLFLTANIVGGLEPIEYVWTGPNGFYSEDPNPVIPNASLSADGWYYLTVTDGYGCPPIEDSAHLNMIPSPNASISPSDTVCLNDPEPLVIFTASDGSAPYTFSYTLNGGPVQTILSAGNTATLNAPTNTSGIYVYVLTGVSDENSCDRVENDTCIITVGDLPGNQISGTSLMCPNDTAIYSGPIGLSSYLWIVSGNGSILGSNTEDTVTVISGSDCNTTFTINLSVSNDFGCDSTASMVVSVQDIIAPDWTTVAGSLDTTLECSDISGLANAQSLTPSATDNCTSLLVPVKTTGSFNSVRM